MNLIILNNVFKKLLLAKVLRCFGNYNYVCSQEFEKIQRGMELYACLQIPSCMLMKPHCLNFFAEFQVHFDHFGYANARFLYVEQSYT